MAWLPAQSTTSRSWFRLRRENSSANSASRFWLQCGFMRKRGAIRNGLEFGLAVGIIKSLEWAPLPLACWLAQAYAKFLDVLVPRLRQTARRNLALALPHLDEVARERLIDGVFR